MYVSKVKTHKFIGVVTLLSLQQLMKLHNVIFRNKSPVFRTLCINLVTSTELHACLWQIGVQLKLYSSP